METDTMTEEERNAFTTMFGRFINEEPAMGLQLIAVCIDKFMQASGAGTWALTTRDDNDDVVYSVFVVSGDSDEDGIMQTAMDKLEEQADA